MDILKYSALNTINNTCAFINGGANTAANTAGFAAGNTAAAGLGPADANNWQANGTTYVSHQTLLGAGWCNSFDNMPWCASSWAGAIPRMPGSTDTANAGINFVTGAEYCGYKVCATNLYGQASNVWTVPAGTKYARFQIWGAGGGGGSGCCCGGSTWGVQGAYASVIIPVVPGCQYTLCAGCAIASATIWGSWAGRSCKSFVTGYGLNNFCAEGGECLAHYILRYRDYEAYGLTAGCCRWNAPDCWTSSGGCICNGNLDWCFSNSCSSCGMIPYARAFNTNYYGCYDGPITAYSSVLDINFLKGMQVVGIPGLHGSMCFDTNYYGCSFATAVYGYENTTQCVISFAGSTTGGVCCNHVGYTYRRAPGAGASSTHLFGGCTAMCDPTGNLSCGGDIGRSGMVCVTWF